MSCPPAGNCEAVGSLETSPGNYQAFAADGQLLPATTTTVAVSATGLTYGQEQAEQVWVAVTALCRHLTLAVGQAGCTVPATALPAGTWQLTASYSGSGALASSASAAQTLTVARAASATTLALSAAKVTYGHEQAERVSVAVAAPWGGIPSGTVTVKAGTTVVCANLTLAAGQAACTVPATRLPAGTWPLTASYGGSGGLWASAFAAQALTVAKAAAKATLSMSAARVTYGHERSERLTVKVTGQYAETPAGKVTVKSGKVTVCTITLASGRGSCTLAAREFPVGTRTLVAVYSGSGDFTGAASARKTLKAVR
jgi:hypothetical protein